MALPFFIHVMYCKRISSLHLNHGVARNQMQVYNQKIIKLPYGLYTCNCRVSVMTLSISYLNSIFVMIFIDLHLNRAYNLTTKYIVVRKLKSITIS